MADSKDHNTDADFAIKIENDDFLTDDANTNLESKLFTESIDLTGLNGVIKNTLGFDENSAPEDNFITHDSIADEDIKFEDDLFLNDEFMIDDHHEAFIAPESGDDNVEAQD